MELPPFFTDDEALASDLFRHGREQNDNLWRLPLWRNYESAIDSPIADVNNAPEYPLAGAITAALFLDRFVSNSKSWAHFDIPAWTDRPKPGRRRGAEANAVRAMFAVIAQRFTAAA
jgi:leucyl aminopeptidase